MFKVMKSGSRGRGRQRICRDSASRVRNSAGNVEMGTCEDMEDSQSGGFRTVSRNEIWRKDGREADRQDE